MEKCSHCLEKIKEDYYRTKDGEVYCEECYYEQFEFTCPICEEHCENPSTPQGHYVYLQHEVDGHIPGFYNVVEFPVYRSDYFSATIIEGSLKLNNDNRVYKSDSESEHSGFICKDCFDKKGLDKWHVECHIKQTVQAKYDKLGITDYKHIAIRISPQYFKILEGKVIWKKCLVTECYRLSTQEIEIDFLTNSPTP